MIRAQSDTTNIHNADTAYYVNPEMPASFPGGQAGWAKYLVKNLQYPAYAQSLGQQGVVITTFIVDTTGALSEFAVILGYKELGKEAIRLLKKSPPWIPAMNNGKKVKSKFWQTITFRLEGF